MNSLILSLKKSPHFFAYSYVFLSVILLIINVLNLIDFEAFKTIYKFAENNIEFFFGLLAVFFVSYYNYGGKKGITSALAFSLGDAVFYCVTGEHYSLVFCVIVAFAFSKLIKDLDLVYAYVLLLAISLIFSIVVALSYDYLYLLLRKFCSFMKNKQLLFGAFGNAYSMFFSDNFADLYYSKDYSASTVINEQIVSGAKEIFIADVNNPQRNVAIYLTGKYFVNIFVCAGVYVSLYSHFHEEELSAFSLVLALSVLFGDVKLFSLFILLYNPIIYLAFLFACFISYLLPMLLDIRIGFYDNGSIIELIKYGQKWGYFILTGIIISVLTYLLIQMVISKFDIQKQKVLPREVRHIINALGGKRNIEKITSEKLYVKNPNLIDVLSLDCDINENEITLHYGDLELLKEYY